MKLALWILVGTLFLGLSWYLLDADQSPSQPTVSARPLERFQGRETASLKPAILSLPPREIPVVTKEASHHGGSALAPKEVAESRPDAGPLIQLEDLTNPGDAGSSQELVDEVTWDSVELPTDAWVYLHRKGVSVCFKCSLFDADGISTLRVIEYSAPAGVLFDPDNTPTPHDVRIFHQQQFTFTKAGEQDGIMNTHGPGYRRELRIRLPNPERGEAGYVSLRWFRTRK